MNRPVTLLLCVALTVLCTLNGCGSSRAERPNIVRISLEDITPMMGSYGDQ